MLAGLPKEIEEFIINPEETCSICDGELKIIGKKLIRTEVEFIPAKLKVKQIVQQVAKCTKCRNEESENPKNHFQKAAVPNQVLVHSIATASLVATLSSLITTIMQNMKQVIDITIDRGIRNDFKIIVGGTPTS